MLTSLLWCVTMAWAPATGLVEACNLYIDAAIEQAGIPQEPTSVCLKDQLPHRVTVQCHDADGNVTPMSAESDVIEMVITPPFHVRPVDPAVRADIDGDGVVGFSDFTLFAREWGNRNDGLEKVP